MLRPSSPPAPAAAPGVADFESVFGEAAPISSFNIPAITLDSAYSRRITFTTTSGFVSTSRAFTIFSKNFMFSRRVMKISRFVRSSATMSTLPRIMPRSASATICASISGEAGLDEGEDGAGVVVGRITPGIVRDWTTPGDPASFVPVTFSVLPSSFCDSAINSSSFCLISDALACRMGMICVSSRASEGWSR